jgi:hypothetical protein
MGALWLHLLRQADQLEHLVPAGAAGHLRLQSLLLNPQR